MSAEHSIAGGSVDGERTEEIGDLDDDWTMHRANQNGQEPCDKNERNNGDYTQKKIRRMLYPCPLEFS